MGGGWRRTPERAGLRTPSRTGAVIRCWCRLVSSIFQLLRVSASLSNGTLWWSIHAQEPNLIPFEVGHTVELPRWAYNGKKFAEVEAKKKSVRARTRG